MALQVWLPLNGDLHNQGLSKITVTNNGATVDNNGKIGKCYSFNNNKTISSTVNISASPISVSVWVYVTSFHDKWNYVVSLNDNSGYVDTCIGICLESSNKICFVAGGNSSLVHTHTESLVGKWTHLATTFDGNTIKGYINGNNVCSLSSTTTLTKTNFTIGNRNGGSSELNLNGKVNDVRLYDHCLSPKEVHEIAKGLVLHYKLDDPNIDSNINLVPSNYWNGSKSSSLLANTISYNIINYPTINVQTNTTYYWRIEIRVISGGDNLTYLGIDTNCSAENYSGNDSAHTVITVVNPDLSKIKNKEWQTAYCITTIKSDATNPKIFHSIYGTSSTATTIQVEYRNFMLVASSSIVPLRFYHYNIIYDSSGYGNNGTISGTLVINNNSPRYNCSTQVTTNGRIIYPYPRFQIFTYSFWFKRNRTSYSNREMLGTGWYGISMEINENNTLSFRHYLNSTGIWDVRSNTAFTSTSNWYYITLTRDASGVSKIYVNGVLDNSGTNTNQINYTSSTAELFTYSGNSYQFQGSISDFRIYATALSEDDIKDLYNTPTFIDNQGDILTGEFVEESPTERELYPLPINVSSSTITIDGYKFSGYQFIVSEYIPINPSGKTYYYDVEYSNTSGNHLYIGFERYDANKASGSNNECQYVVDTTSVANHVRVTGTINLSTANGNTAAFTRLRILNDWDSSRPGTASHISIIHYISLKEVSSVQASTNITKNGLFIGNTFINSKESSISKTGNVIGNQFIEI